MKMGWETPASDINTWDEKTDWARCSAEPIESMFSDKQARRALSVCTEVGNLLLQSMEQNSHR